MLIETQRLRLTQQPRVMQMLSRTLMLRWRWMGSGMGQGSETQMVMLMGIVGRAACHGMVK